MADVVRLDFGEPRGPRKLVARHRFLRDCVRTSGKSITELMSDPFGGYPFLLAALLTPSAKQGEGINLDKASDLIDDYIAKHKSIEGLTNGLVQCLSAYLHVELTPTEDEGEGDHAPNAATPDAPGPSAA